MIIAPAYPHDPIEEITTDVFMVRGSIPLNTLLTISRNMAIIRHGDELTLVNPMRLEEPEEARLRELGTVRRILRLGPLHGVDDPYYMEVFGAELWTPGKSLAYPTPEPTRMFDEATDLPFPNARVLCFNASKQPEALLWLDRGPGVVLSCDSLQHYGDYRFCNLPARIVMPWIGFPKTTVVGPIWLKMMTPRNQSLQPDFQRLLELFQFDILLGGHGSLLATGAHESVANAVHEAFQD